MGAQWVGPPPAPPGAGCYEQRMWKGYRKRLRLLGRNTGHKCSTKTGSFAIKDGQEILVDPNHFVYLPKYPLLI